MMRLVKSLLILGSTVTFLSTASAEEKAKEDMKAKSVTLTCSSGSDKRIIVTDAKEGGGCDVTYTKDGQSQPVASARNEVEYCDGVVQKMKSTLEGAGFKCE